jgi:hypothetical protein
LTPRPVERVEAEQAYHGERLNEADEPDRDGGAPLPPELRDVDLRAGEERQHDARERAEEGKPARHVEAERVADDHAH